MKVLVIPEDFRKDQYILKPIVTALLERVPGGSTARVIVCQDPLLGGIEQAMRWDRLVEVLDMYPMIDVFLLLVDRDAVATRREALDKLEQRAAKHLGPKRRFLAEHAWQELEIWTLAGHELPREWRWKEVREERDSKERYFLPFAQARGVIDEPGEGRKTLSMEAATQFRRIASRCPDDIAALVQRLSPQPTRRARR